MAPTSTSSMQPPSTSASTWHRPPSPAHSSTSSSQQSMGFLQPSLDLSMTPHMGLSSQSLAMPTSGAAASAAAAAALPALPALPAPASLSASLSITPLSQPLDLEFTPSITRMLLQSMPISDAANGVDAVDLAADAGAAVVAVAAKAGVDDSDGSQLQSCLDGWRASSAKRRRAPSASSGPDASAAVPVESAPPAKRTRATSSASASITASASTTAAPGHPSNPANPNPNPNPSISLARALAHATNLGKPARPSASASASASNAASSKTTYPTVRIQTGDAVGEGFHVVAGERVAFEAPLAAGARLASARVRNATADDYVRVAWLKQERAHQRRLAPRISAAADAGTGLAALAGLATLAGLAAPSDAEPQPCPLPSQGDDEEDAGFALLAMFEKQFLEYIHPQTNASAARVEARLTLLDAEFNAALGRGHVTIPSFGSGSGSSISSSATSPSGAGWPHRFGVLVLVLEDGRVLESAPFELCVGRVAPADATRCVTGRYVFKSSEGTTFYNQTGGRSPFMVVAGVERGEGVTVHAFDLVQLNTRRDLVIHRDSNASTKAKRLAKRVKRGEVTSLESCGAIREYVELPVLERCNKGALRDEEPPHVRINAVGFFMLVCCKPGCVPLVTERVVVRSKNKGKYRALGPAGEVEGAGAGRAARGRAAASSAASLAAPAASSAARPRRPRRAADDDDDDDEDEDCDFAPGSGDGDDDTDADM